MEIEIPPCLRGGDRRTEKFRAYLLCTSVSLESYNSLDNDSRLVIVLTELGRAAPLLFLKNAVEIAEVVESAAETDF